MLRKIMQHLFENCDESPEPISDEQIAEAVKAREDAEQMLNEARAKIKEVNKLVAKDQRILKRNGFADLVWDAMRGQS